MHTWERLSPFSYIADMIDVMSLFVKLMLVSVVLISIMNVMIMAVYERVRRGSEKRKKTAIVAVARRLLIRCWAMLRDETPWREPETEVILRLAA